jgi:hypothetical protein
MDCRQCTENLTAYLDGELSHADSAQLRAHLETCVSCAVELSGFQEAADFVESHNRELDIRPECWNKVYDQIIAERPSPFRFLFPKQWSQILATLAIVAALAFGYLWYQQDQKRSLDDYISQYVKAREASQAFRLMTHTPGFRAQTMNLFPDNPFAEAKPAIDINPFRLEDR